MNNNGIRFEFASDAKNEGLARVVVASYLTRTNPTLTEIEDVKTAVSEAVTNSIIHGYDGKAGTIVINAYIEGRELSLEIIDYGCGIADINKAMEPMYSSKKDGNRSGMGFSFMEAFMDELVVESEVGKGTTVKMKKKIGYDLETY